VLNIRLCSRVAVAVKGLRVGLPVSGYGSGLPLSFVEADRPDLGKGMNRSVHDFRSETGSCAAVRSLQLSPGEASSVRTMMTLE